MEVFKIPVSVGVEFQYCDNHNCKYTKQKKVSLRLWNKIHILFKIKIKVFSKVIEYWVYNRFRHYSNILSISKNSIYFVKSTIKIFLLIMHLHFNHALAQGMLIWTYMKCKSHSYLRSHTYSVEWRQMELCSGALAVICLPETPVSSYQERPSSMTETGTMEALCLVPHKGDRVNSWARKRRWLLECSTAVATVD